jgi:protein-tyrosine phosphatase
MADVSFITPWLAVGGAINDDEEAADVIRLGITHVINCRLSDDLASLQRRVQYFHDPAMDDGQAKLPEWFLSAVRFARAARTSPNAKILVHCRGGEHRSPALAYAILRAAGSSPDEAEAAIMAVRPIARFPYRESAEAALVPGARLL